MVIDPRFPPEYERSNGWTRWVQPIPRGYLMACCDCQLVHRLEFRIFRGRVQFRAQRAPGITRQHRAAQVKKKLAD